MTHKSNESGRCLKCVATKLELTRFSTCGVGSVGRVLALFGPQCCLHSVEVRFFLELAYVLLVTNSLVAKPIGDLKKLISCVFI